MVLGEKLSFGGSLEVARVNAGVGIFVIVAVLHRSHSLSCVRFFVTPWTVAGQAPLFPLQGIFLTQGPRDRARVFCSSGIGRRILCHLGHYGARRIKPVFLAVGVPSLNRWTARETLGGGFCCKTHLSAFPARFHVGVHAGGTQLVCRVRLYSQGLFYYVSRYLCFTYIHCSDLICSL